MSDTKNSIFRAAIVIFSKSGYNGATMDEIAAEAGVAKGTLYYHFKSKEEIFRYIVKEGMNFMKAQLTIATEHESEPVSRLKALCEVQLNLVSQNRDFFKVLMSQVWGQEDRQQELRGIMDDYIAFIETYLKEAVDKKIIKSGNTKFMAYNFFGTLCSTAIYELLNEFNTDIHELIDSLTVYILNGIIM